MEYSGVPGIGRNIFGEKRCLYTSFAESALIGIAIGLTLRGFDPVPEIQFDGFSYPVFDRWSAF